MRLLYLGPKETIEHVRISLPREFDVCPAADGAGVDRIIQSCDVILDAQMGVRFPLDRIERAANLKLFVTATTGADHIDASALAQRGIPLLTLKGQQKVLRDLTPAAEHSWLLLMACARRLRAAVQGVLEGYWDRTDYPGIMLRGKTLGIIGCGRIGQKMSQYAAAFGMRCVGHDPYVDPWPEGIERTGLGPLLANSDFISVHVPLSPDTRRMLGPQQFEAVKPGAVFVNTSRGDVIDESALLSALLSGRIAAAGLDVLSGEPDVADHGLVRYARTHTNLIITPHIGGFSPEALNLVLTFSCERIAEFFRG